MLIENSDWVSVKKNTKKTKTPEHVVLQNKFMQKVLLTETDQ